MKNSNWLKIWFAERGMIPFNYQEQIILEKIDYLLNKDGKCVLAACPNSGKTVMSIAFIEKYLIDNPKARVLVLTHGTTVLRTQYYQEVLSLKPNFTHKKIEAKYDLSNFKEQVAIALPQSLKDSSIKFDLIVIDEAHHFYFDRKDRKGMVKSIIDKNKPKHQLMLTGTPSKFILRKFEIIPVTVNDIYDNGQCADLIVELATTNYSIKLSDYNQNFEIKDKIKETQSQTNFSLNDVLSKIESRLKSIYKNNPKVYSELKQNIGWSVALKTLNKTMIACRNKEQASNVKNYFNMKGIDCALSISETDKDSQEIERFKTDGSCKVLIVIFRGVLGLNMATLENVIDLTGSQNIDRIFQLMCRVTRKHPNNKEKLFIKCAPMGMVDYFHTVMTAVLCLCDEEYYTTYNTKNFFDMKVPKTNSKNSSTPKSSTGSKKSKIKLNDFIGLPVIEFFKSLKHRRNDAISGVEYTTIGEARNSLLTLKKWTTEECLEEAFKYNNIRDWRNGSSASYSHASKRKDLYEKCISHMEKLQNVFGYWTLEKCKEIFKLYNSASEINKSKVKGHSSAYSIAVSRGWVKECSSHFEAKKVVANFYTLEKCKEDSIKYNRKKDWRNSGSKFYHQASKNGWMEECTAHMEQERLPMGYWNSYENCKNAASECKTNKDFRKKFSAARQSAYKNGWLKEITKHFILIRKQK